MGERWTDDDGDLDGVVVCKKADGEVEEVRVNTGRGLAGDDALWLDGDLASEAGERMPTARAAGDAEPSSF